MNAHTTDKPRDWFPWTVFAVAVVVRMLYFVQYCRSPMLGYLRADHVFYLEWARHIAAGDWWGSGVFQQTPLYPYLMGLTISVIGERMGVILIGQLFLGVASCVLLYSVARRLFGRPTAFVAGLLMALYGPCVFYECLVMKSFLSPILTVLSLYAVVRYRDQHQRRWVWIAGFFVGAACLVAENHILLLLPLGAWLWQHTSRVDTNWKCRLLVPAQLMLATFLALMPSLLRNLVVAGELIFVTSGGGEVLYLGHGPTAGPYYSTPSFVTGNPFLEHEDFRREAERRSGQTLNYGESSRYWAREAFREMTSAPLRTARRTLQKGAVLFNDHEVPDGENYAVATEFIPLLRWLPSFGMIGGLGVLGVCVCLTRWRRDWLIVGVAATHIFTVLLLYNFGRFRLGLMPMWILLAAIGVTWLADALRRPWSLGGWPRWLGLGFAVAISLWMLRPPLGRIPPGHLAGQAMSIGHLRQRQGDNTAAAQQYRRVLVIYRSADLSQPKIARLVTRASLELARIAIEDQQLSEAGEHLRMARRLSNRDDVREEVSLEWQNYLLTAQKTGQTVPEVGDIAAALSDVHEELAHLRKGQIR